MEYQMGENESEELAKQIHESQERSVRLKSPNKILVVDEHSQL